MSVERLSDRACRAIGIGMWADGRGLYLQVRQGANGLTRSWVYRYTVDGRQHWMGLGGYPDVSLAQARRKAQDARASRAEGVDVLAAKRAQRAALSHASAKQMTFGECADAYIKMHRVGWRSVQHAKWWDRSMEKYVLPLLGGLPVAEIDTALVMKVLEPIWLRTPESATHIRQRIEAVLDWATAREYRQGANPARWRGHLDKVLPSRSKVRPVVHHPALPYVEVPAFMAELRGREAIAARALEFAILTVAPLGEVLGMKWGEIDHLNR